jgi:hypothetical protein
MMRSTSQQERSTMRFVLSYHSLDFRCSHGKAHLLRGIADELFARRRAVRIFEPVDTGIYLYLDQSAQTRRIWPSK